MKVMLVNGSSHEHGTTMMAIEEMIKVFNTDMHLVSGAGHDAQIFGKEIPAAMLFVPSASGRSHCPEEKSSPEYLALAVKIAYEAIIRLNTMTEIV